MDHAAAPGQRPAAPLSAVVAARPAAFRSVSGTNPVDRVVSQIAEAVWLGDLQVGDPLPAERSLSAMLQVSRPTLRLAMRRLESAGLVEVGRGRGGGPRIVSGVVPLSLLERLPEVTRAEVMGLLVARRAIEPQIAQLAAARATDEDIARLEALVDGQRRVGPNWMLHGQLDTRFHLELARATHNSTIFATMRELLLRLEVARSELLRSPHDDEVVADIHAKTVAAVASRDPQRVARAMDEHLGWLERVWERETGRSVLRELPEVLTAPDPRPQGVRRERRRPSA